MKILIYADMAIWTYRLHEFKLNEIRNILVYFTSSEDIQHISNVVFEVGSQKRLLNDIQENYLGYFGFLEDTPEDAETVSVFSYNSNGKIFIRDERNLVVDISALPSRQILKRLGIFKMFPVIRNDYYICSCGAVNRASSNTCFSCQGSRSRIEEFVNEGFTGFLLKEYIQRNPAVYNAEKSLYENINDYALPVIKACGNYYEFNAQGFMDQLAQMYMNSLPERAKKKKSLFNKTEENITFYIK